MVNKVFRLIYFSLIFFFLIGICNGGMYQEELSDADVTVGWYHVGIPLYFGIHVIGDTGEEGITRWVHVEGIPLLITIMEFTHGKDGVIGDIVIDKQGFFFSDTQMGREHGN